MTQLSLPGILPDYRERRYRRYIALNHSHFRARHVYHFARAIRLSYAINRMCRVGVVAISPILKLRSVVFDRS